MIDFSTLQGLTIPESVVTQIADSSGRVLWSAKKKMCTVTIMSSFTGPPTFTYDDMYVIINEHKYIVEKTAPITDSETGLVTSVRIATLDVPYGTKIHCYNSKNDIRVGYVLVGSNVTEYDHIVKENTVIHFSGFGTTNYPNNDPIFMFGTIDITEVPEGAASLSVSLLTYSTYANSTDYSDERFVLLNITPKDSNSTVKVTYGSLTKTLTFTSTLPQKVFFGTFNGVSDGVAPPGSGTLTIEGDYNAFGIGAFNKTKTATAFCTCITAICDFGNIIYISDNAFANCYITNESITIPYGVVVIGTRAFAGCYAVSTFILPSSIVSISASAFYITLGGDDTFILQRPKPPAIGAEIFYPANIASIIVPKGCGDAYKTAEGWSEYSDYITEES